MMDHPSVLALQTGVPQRCYSQDEIADALGVAVAMNAGAALVYSARVLDAVHSYQAER